MVTSEKLLDLLCLAFSKEETKRRPFSNEFVAFGVEIDFMRTQEGAVVVRNKPSRVVAQEEMLSKILSQEELS